VTLEPAGEPAELSAAENACLVLAWEALCRGSIPVGAVITDAAGRIVATGRNRMRDAARQPPELTGGLLSHAEVNAIARLDPDAKYQDHQLVTSLEPCPLCLGALAMSTIGAAVFLGADPYGGAAAGPRAATRHTARFPLHVAGPRTDRPGRLAAGLHLAYFLRRNPAGHVVTGYRADRPDLAGAAGALVSAGLFDLAAAGLPWAAVSGQLLSAV